MSIGERYEVVVIRTDKPIGESENFTWISEDVLRREAKKNGWRVEPVPGNEGHYQAVANDSASLVGQTFNPRGYVPGELSIGCEVKKDAKI